LLAGWIDTLPLTTCLPKLFAAPERACDEQRGGTNVPNGHGCSSGTRGVSLKRLPSGRLQRRTLLGPSPSANLAGFEEKGTKSLAVMRESAERVLRALFVSWDEVKA
jgi:hypothetical protein